MKHNQDWTPVDLEALPPDAIPVTQYKPRGDEQQYNAAYTRWENGDSRVSPREYYRIAWRAMAANTGERTLIPAIIPPGTAHPHTVSSAGSSGVTLLDLVGALGFLSTLLADFLVRAVPKSGILMSTINALPFVASTSYSAEIVERVLRLSCLTSEYDALWEEVMDTPWTPEVPYRMAADRRMALVEIDALVALSLGVTIDELITVYRTQFPVLYGYDHKEYLYDAEGRTVPSGIRQAWQQRGLTQDSLLFPVNERSYSHPGSGAIYSCELPFAFRNREQDLRDAYSHFCADEREKHTPS